MNVALMLERLLDSLPMHAEEGPARQVAGENALIECMGSEFEFALKLTALHIVRSIFGALALLDRQLLVDAQWAFVSFPAALTARSLLATLAIPGQTLVANHYWEQGLHRPASDVEEQRQLLHELETRRERFHPANSAKPIRTVHVAWGVIKIQDRFLLIRRDDKRRPNTKDFGLPGGRLNLIDLPIEAQGADSLPDLFRIDSGLATSALQRTLARELEEECGLIAGQYSAHDPKILPPYKKVEGVGNLHGLSQYNIYVYPIKLKAEGELRLLQAEYENSSGMVWFTLDEIMNDSRSDGKRAFVDAIKSAAGVDPVQFLQALPDSAALNWMHIKETDALDLPGAFEEPFQIGKTGKEATRSVPLDQLEWELLLLMGWHAKNLPVAANTEDVNLLGNGWIRLMTATAVDAAARLVAKMTAAGLPTPQLQIESFCRLSVDPKHLFLSRVMYSYSLPDGDSEQTLTLTLKAVKTTWGTLQSKSADFDLPRNMVRAIHALENGQDPALAGGIKSDNLSRLVFSAFQGIQPLGLRKFIYANKPRFHLAVVSSQVVVR
jgi:8-oxo-dGTP pyrophosphatase MutT (NUDIX family)